MLRYWSLWIVIFSALSFTKVYSGTTPSVPWVDGWLYDAAQAKIQAKEYNRPIFVYASKTAGCDNCKIVWSRVTGTKAWLDWAKENQIVLYYLNVIDKSREFSKVHSYYGSGLNAYPIFYFFHINGEISDNYFSPSVADILTKGQYTSGLNFNSLTGIITGVFPNSYWDTLTPPPLPDLDDVQELSIPTSEAPPLKDIEGVTHINNAGWVIRVPTDLSDDAIERMYSFSAAAGKRYYFSTTKYANTTAFDLNCAFFTADADKQPIGDALKSVPGNGFTPLANGIFFDCTAAGTYILKLTRTAVLRGSETVFPFELRASMIDSPSEQEADRGDTVSNPLRNGAILGKWTLDYKAAKQQALEHGQSLILLFSGVRWCPYCVGLENTVFTDESFKDSLKNSYLVIIDNRRRDGTGPCLLMDFGWTEEDASAGPLKDNLELQDKLSLPGADSQRKIGYPHFLYCRPDGSVVGRFTTLLTHPESVSLPAMMKKKLNYLIALAEADKDEEADNYADTSTSVLNLNGENPAFSIPPASIGGSADIIVDNYDWRKISFPGGTDWKIKVVRIDEQRSGTIPAGTVNLAIYDCQGTGSWAGNILTREFSNKSVEYSSQGTWANPPSLEYRSEGTNAIDRRILVSVADMTEATKYTLEFTPSYFPPYDVAFTASVITALRSDSKYSIPVKWQRHEEPSGSGKIKYSTSSTDFSNFLYEQHQNIEVIFGEDGEDNAIKEGEFTITGNLNLKSLTGSNAPTTIFCDLAASVDGNCRIVGPNQAEIKIYSLPAFIGYDAGAEISFKLIQDLVMDTIQLPIANGEGGTVSVDVVAGSLPEGLQYTVDKATPGYPVLVITGTPSTVNNYSVTFATKTTTATDVLPGASITVNFIIDTIDKVNKYAKVTDFAGTLYQSNGVRGTLHISKGAEKGLIATIKAGRDNELTLSAEGWCSAGENNICAEFTAQTRDNSSTLRLTVDATGVGTGVFTAAAGQRYTFVCLPLPWSETVTATQYEGYYTGSLDSKGPNGHLEFQGTGIFSLTVAENGYVVYWGLMPDGQEFSGTTVLLKDGQYAAATIYETLGSSTGMLGGRVFITPKTERVEGNSSVSSCEDGDIFQWRHDGEEEVYPLEPCGTEYDNAKTLTEQLGDSIPLVFELQRNVPKQTVYLDAAGNIPALTAFLPQGVLIKENDNNSFAILSTVDEDLNLSLEYTKGTGKLTGKFNLFTAVATSTEVSLRGIITQRPGSCCSVVSPVVGQGLLLLKDVSNQVIRTYGVRILAGVDIPTTTVDKPTLTAITNAIAGQFEDDIYLVTNTDNTVSITLTLSELPTDALFVYSKDTEVHFSLSNTFSLDNAKHDYSFWVILNGIRSDALPFKLRLPSKIESAFVFPVSAKPWKLFAIPSDFRPAPQTLQEDCPVLIFSMDGLLKAYQKLDISAVKPGSAFWAFCNLQNDAVFTVTGYPYAEDYSLATGKWLFVAAPQPVTVNDTIFCWQNGKFVYRDLEDAQPLDNTVGVWLFRDAE